MVKVLKVFKPDNAGNSIDKSQPFSYSNRIACKHDSPDLLPKQEQIFSNKVC
jgi:hypothetical protein